ncbi:MAG: hypothetical protein ACHBN1_14790 [Heteroscytonema crispum UTEX LB 1556]
MPQKHKNFRCDRHHRSNIYYHHARLARQVELRSLESGDRV